MRLQSLEIVDVVECNTIKQDRGRHQRKYVPSIRKFCCLELNSNEITHTMASIHDFLLFAVTLLTHVFKYTFSITNLKRRHLFIIIICELIAIYN